MSCGTGRGRTGRVTGVYGDDMVAQNRVLGLSPVGSCCGGNFKCSMLLAIDQHQSTHEQAP